VTVPGLRNRVMANAARLAPGWISALLTRRLLRPADAPVTTSKEPTS
jgi:hypothetical protein